MERQDADKSLAERVRDVAQRIGDVWCGGIPYHPLESIADDVRDLELAADMEATHADELHVRVGQLREALEDQAEMWDMAKDEIESAALAHCRVPFTAVHKPAEAARAVLNEE